MYSARTRRIQKCPHFISYGNVALVTVRFLFLYLCYITKFKPSSTTEVLFLLRKETE